MKPSSSSRFSTLAAWAVAFGTAVGWGSFVMPGTSFLPKAGPLGTVIGLIAGGVVMSVIAWNYRFMIGRMPGPGGAFSYAKRAFGDDHGFLCAWFLCLTYVAIVWANATALAIVFHSALGDVFRFGYLYSLGGYDVYLGEMLLSGIALAAACAICLRRGLSSTVQVVLAVAFATGIAVCFVAVACRHSGGLQAMTPAFSPSGALPISQILKIVALAPWLFVGFESISHLSGEFAFPRRKSFGVMAVALATSVVAYALLSVLPTLVPQEGGWAASVFGGADSRSDLSLSTFATVERALGRAGVVAISLTMIGAVFTNLVGNMVVVSRLVASMSDEGMLPRWAGLRSADGTPRRAILAVAGVSLVTAFFGRTAIGFIVDVATIGAAIAYAYTSAAAFRTARGPGGRLARVTGACGLVLSVALCILFIMPNYLSGKMMATESYLLIVVWCILGFLFYRSLFLRDQRNRFGRSTIVWIALQLLIFFMSHLWLRQSAQDAEQETFESLSRFHAEVCQSGKDAGDGWNENLRRQLESVNRAFARDGLVQLGLLVVSLAIMFSLYAILRRRERDLEREKARARSYFFSTVSHDIRTPLNAIIGFSEMLKAGFKTEAEREQALDAILVSGRTLLDLINDVLDLSKLESGKMEIAPEPTDCRRLLGELMDALRVSGGKPGLELRCVVGEMPPLMLDPQRLRQIVFNLVGNAIKFTDHGHVEIRASYDLPDDAPSGVFRLEVEDTGCGISEEDLKRIGSAYVQVGSKLARNGGTGLGLAICGQLAAAMGGRLDVKSALGIGSTFSVVVPGVRPATADRGESAAPEAESVPAPRVDSASAPRRILAVDDSRLNLMVLKALLKGMGDFEVVSAVDGQEALKILESPSEKPFDLVLTDMWMPNLDGEGLAKAIRANPALASLRVIVVTADVEFREKAAEMGFDGILLKPITGEKLSRILVG